MCLSPIIEESYFFCNLKDKRPIGRFLLALAEGRLVKNLTDERGGSDALIVRWKLLQNICSYKKSGNQHSKHE